MPVTAKLSIVRERARTPQTIPGIPHGKCAAPRLHRPAGSGLALASQIRLSARPPEPAAPQIGPR